MKKNLIIIILGVMVFKEVLIPLGLDDNVWYVVLAFVAGFMGVLITPLHLCAVITAEFFEVNISKMLFRVFIPVIVILIICTIMFFAL